MSLVINLSVFVYLDLTSIFYSPASSSPIVTMYQLSMLIYFVSLVFRPLELVCLVDFPIRAVCVILAVGMVVVFGWVHGVVVVMVVGFRFPVIGLHVI
jgi:hypothetical protein